MPVNSAQGVDLSESIQSEVLAGNATTYIIAAIAVAARFLARRLKKTYLWYDDWFILTALVSAAGWFGVCIRWFNSGLGQHYQVVDLTYDTYLHNNLLSIFCCEIFYSSTTALAKLSILCFYWRIFNSSSIRWPIRIVGAIVIAWFLARMFTIFLHCFPLEGYWDKSVPATCGVSDREFFMGTNTANVIMDLIILSLPLPYIFKLRVSGSQKVVIFALFLFGGLITVSSIVTAVVCYRFDDTSPDVGWQISPVALWGGVELNMAIACACFPSLRPVYRLIRGRSNTPSRHDTRYTSDSSRTKSHFASFLSTSTHGRKNSGNDSSHHIVSSDGNELAVEIPDWDPDLPRPEVVVAADDVQLSRMKGEGITVRNDVRVDEQWGLR